MIWEQYLEIEAKMKEALAAAGRPIDSARLLAVSKTHPLEAVEELAAHGVKAFGENKVQEFLSKKDELHLDGVEKHLIGHLQTNKVKYVVDKACLIHSVDSLRLAEQINSEAEKKNVICNILIEVNIAGEESKFGVAKDEVKPLLEAIKNLKHVHVKGLMTIAPFVDDAEDNRKYFREMHKLFIDMRQEKADNIEMEVLSMGMTGDYQVAIEEGATMVRVGTGIFGERNYNI